MITRVKTGIRGVIGRFSRPTPTPAMSNRERNIHLILHGPPKPKISERVASWLFDVEEWWCRHVSQRELYRYLDRVRVKDRPHIDTHAALMRLSSRLADDSSHPQEPR